jgi:hypothetical protein
MGFVETVVADHKIKLEIWSFMEELFRFCSLLFLNGHKKPLIQVGLVALQQITTRVRGFASPL